MNTTTIDKLRADYAKNYKIINERNKESWEEALEILKADPSRDINSFRNYAKFSSVSQKAFLVKMKILLENLEIGRTYTADQVKDILLDNGITAERVGTTINKVFYSYSEPGDTTYLILGVR